MRRDFSEAVVSSQFSDGGESSARQAQSHRATETTRSRSVCRLFWENGTSSVVSINAVGNFAFRRTVDLKTRSVDVAISEPQGQKIRVRMQPMNDDLGYSVEGPSRPGARN
jgi:hypothetical protein